MYQNREIPGEFNGKNGKIGAGFVHAASLCSFGKRDAEPHMHPVQARDLWPVPGEQPQNRPDFRCALGVCAAVFDGRGCFITACQPGITI